VYASVVIVKVGVRELRERLRYWIDRAAAGDEIVVTERGKPRARLTSVDWEHTRDQLIRAGILTPAEVPKGSRPLPKPIKIKGGIQDILRDSRGRF
jgi:prevent-host-death family protein